MIYKLFYNVSVLKCRIQNKESKKKISHMFITCRTHTRTQLEAPRQERSRWALIYLWVELLMDC